MVVKKEILATIKKLDSLYNSAPATESTYYSKLAIIEFCGWIESSMDSMVQAFVNKKVKTAPFKNIFKDDVKGKNFGFDYRSNFRKMLYQTIGLHNTETIEVRMEKTGQITILKTELGNLKRLRNDAAHTPIGATTTYQAPSVTKAQLERIYPILKELSSRIKSVK